MKSLKLKIYSEAIAINTSYVKENRPISVRSYHISRFSENSDTKFKLFIFDSISRDFKVERLIRVILNEL